MRTVRKITAAVFRLLLVLLLSVTVLLGAGWWMIRTDWFQQAAGRHLRETLKRSCGWDAAWSGVRCTSLGSWSCERLSLSDEHGLWLDGRGLTVAVNWSALKKRQVVVEYVQAEEVRILHIPMRRKSAPGEVKNERSWSGRIRFFGLRGAGLNRIGVDRLMVSRGVAGLDSVFTLEAGGKLLRNGSADIQMNLERVDGLAGRAQLDVQLTNGFSQGRVRMEMEEGPGALLHEWFGAAWSPLRIQVEADGGMNGWTGRALCAIGDGENRATWQASFKTVDRALFTLHWRLQVARIAESIYGQVFAYGSLKAPVLEASVHADGSAMTPFVQAPIPPLYLAAELCVSNGALQGSLLSTGLTHCAVNAHIDVPVDLSAVPPRFTVRPEGELSGRVTLDLDLGLLDPWLSAFKQHAQGVLQGDARVHGTPESPVLSGGVQMADGSYEHYGWGTLLRGVNLDVELKNKQALIRRADARDEREGRCSALGRVSFDRHERNPLDLHITLQRMMLVNQPRRSLQVSANAQLDGDFMQMRLAGTCDVKRAALTIGRTLPPGVYEMDVTEVNRPEAMSERRWKRKRRAAGLALDLKVNAPGKIFVEGRGLSTEWNAALHLGGTVREPQVIGELNLVQGTLMFMGKRLNLTQCSMAFNGSRPILPQIDLRAYAVTAELTAYLRIYGSAATPRVEIRSDPVRPQNEILAMLLFGKKTDQLTAPEALTMAYGIQVLRGEAPGDGWLNRAQSRLGLDQINVKQDDKKQTQLTLGRYFGNYLYVEGEKSLKGDGDTVAVELRLTPTLQIRAAAAGAREEGQNLYLNWRRDY